MGDTSEIYDPIVDALLGEPEVSEGVAFGSPSLRVGRRIFVMHDGERIVFKLPAQRCLDLVDAGAARPFEAGGRTMREWVAVSEPGDAGWLALAREAMAFVGSTA